MRAGAPLHQLLLPALVLSAGLTGAASAKAQEGVEPIRIDYEAPPECPSRQEFESRVRARTSRARFGAEGADARVFDVRIDAASPRDGRVTVRRARAVEGTRHVRAESCTDVADALALVVALAVDPSALAAPGSGVAQTPAPVAEPPRAADPAPLPEKPSAAASGGPQVPSAESPAPRERTTNVQSTHRSFALGTDLAFSTGTAPVALVGVSPYLGWTASSKSLVAFSARLGFLHATTGAIDLPGGSATFAWTVGRADGCATAWPTQPVSVSACARIEAGELNATGLRVPSPRSQTRGYVAAGPLARGQWFFARPLFVEAEMAGMIHLTVDRFYFLPDTTAYQAPALGLSGSVGVGVSFL